MKRILTTSSILATITCFAACGGTDREVNGYNETAYAFDESGENNFAWQEGFQGNVDVFDASLRGDIGQITQLNGDATVAGYGEEEYADLELLTVGPSGSAMHFLTFVGGLNHPDLVPGAHLEFSGEGDFDTDGEQLHVMSMNCSGNGDVYDWDYDMPADRVTIDVSETEDEDVVQIHYETQSTANEFGGPVQTSSGSFLLRR